MVTVGKNYVSDKASQFTESVIREMTRVALQYGAVPCPFDSYLVLRGIKTLAVRMREHETNALHLANFLQDHPQIERCLCANSHNIFFCLLQYLVSSASKF